jgi:hypothetical protein
MIIPGFTSLSIGEVLTRTTDGDIHDEVELLVEGGILLPSLPGVVHAFRELTLRPEVFCDGNVQDYVVWGVEVGE